jgi:hypothetical protein
MIIGTWMVRERNKFSHDFCILRSGPEKRKLSALFLVIFMFATRSGIFANLGGVLQGGRVIRWDRGGGEFYAGYGERLEQDKMDEEGEDYLMHEFSVLSYFVRAECVGDDGIHRT